MSGDITQEGSSHNHTNLARIYHLGPVYMCPDKNWTPGASECDPGERERGLIAGAVITNCKGATAQRVTTDRRGQMPLHQ